MMGAKFMARATFSKDVVDKFNKEGNTIAFSGEMSAWMVTAKGSYSRSDQTSSMRTTDSEVHEEDRYTIGTTLPEGSSIQDQLNKWAANDEKIMAHPMPIGDMQLMPIS